MRSRATALVCVLTFSIALLGAVGAAVAQTYQGTIRGIVKDEQGVIPAAEVTLEHVSTGARRAMPASESGDFVAASLAPGEYRVSVRMPGFKSAERAGIFLTAADRLSLGNIAMEIGAVEATAPRKRAS